MKDTWRQLFRRLAASCVVVGSMAWSSAMCYAVQLAYDDATKPAYQSDDANNSNDGNPANNTNGWQAGDNGGFGFTPWNFDAGYWYQGTLTPYSHPGFHAIDDGAQSGTHYSNPFNNIGKSWALGSPANSDGAPRYGRGFPALQVGQTFSAILDNPTRRQFFKGYFVQLNGGTGGVNGNICNQGHSCSNGGTGVGKLNMWRFDYFDYGKWRIADGTSPDNGTYIPLFDTQTAASGMKFSVTLTGANTYELNVYTDPLSATPTLAYSGSGTLQNPGAAIDWFSITFFNPTTDSGTPPTTATDFYIRSLEITGPAAAGINGDFNSDGKVDAGDYVTWRKNNGTNNPLANDNGLGTPIGLNHFNLWRQNLGKPPGAGSSLSGSAVPEPAAFMLLVAGSAGAIAMRSHRKASRRE